jgi:hypothetical protein
MTLDYTNILDLSDGFSTGDVYVRKMFTNRVDLLNENL